MKRRKFILKAGALGATTVLAPGSAHSYAASPIRIGVIGTGDRGTGLMRTMQQIQDFKVTACCDIIPERLKKALKYADVKARGYANYEELLSGKDLDAVIIAVPFKLHAQIAWDSLEADKHVYCEKTMVHTQEWTKKITAKVEESGKVFQVGHQYHSSRLYHKVVDMIQKGYCGTIIAFEGQWNRNHNWRRPVFDPKWEKMINWRMYREYSGGLLAELSSHQIDIVNWITGATPVKVTGFGGIEYWKDGRETFDTIYCIYDYPEAKACFSCLTTNAYEGYQLLIKGTEATIKLRLQEAEIITEKDDPEELGLVDGVSGATLSAWEKGRGAPITVESKEPTLQALLDFAENIQKDKTPETNVKIGAEASRAVEMGLQAMIDEGTVKW